MTILLFKDVTLAYREKDVSTSQTANKRPVTHAFVGDSGRDMQSSICICLQSVDQEYGSNQSPRKSINEAETDFENEIVQEDPSVFIVDHYLL